MKTCDSRHVCSLEIELALGDQHLEQAGHVLHLILQVATGGTVPIWRVRRCLLSVSSSWFLFSVFIPLWREFLERPDLPLST